MKQEKDDIINIFSVASGHLYERFLRLVMLVISECVHEFVTGFLFREYVFYGILPVILLCI